MFEPFLQQDLPAEMESFRSVLVMCEPIRLQEILYPVLVMARTVKLVAVCPRNKSQSMLPTDEAASGAGTGVLGNQTY